MKFLSDIDVDQGSEVLLGSGEYLSWGTSGVTSIEGSTASNRIRFYTSSTLSLTLDSSQNATFTGDATIGSSGSSSDKTLNILTGGTKSSVKLMEAGTVYGFSTVYDGATNKFHINRHNNSAAGTPVLSLNRDDDSATFSGNASLAGSLEVSGGGITLGGTGRIQGIDTVSATTDAANKAYVDAVNVGVTQITAGTNVTISPSGGTGNVTINASGGGGGGGTIDGTIENQEIAVGTATDEIGGQAYFAWSAQNGLQVGNHSQGGGANIITIDRPSSLPGKFIIKQNNTTEFSIVTGGGSTTISTNTQNLFLTDDSTAKVGVGNTSPTEKLDVTGRIKSSKGVQVGEETSTGATSGLVGTFRYRLVNGTATAGTNYSYVDMCMQTGTTGGVNSYEWVNIVTNRW